MHHWARWILHFLLVILSLPFFLLAHSSNVNLVKIKPPKPIPFVTCGIDGQLGNQICQIATTLAYAWDYGALPIFPELNKSSLHTSYNRDRFFFRLNNSSPPRPIQNHYYELRWWEYSPIPFQKDLFLKGTFFCWKHFHHHRQKLIEVFAPSQPVEDYLQKKYAHLLESLNTVSIHVRTYNKEFYDLGFFFVDLNYYEKAMELFPENTIFVVFSDRINWCKHHFSRFHKNIVFAEGNDHIQDFFLMSKMKSHIIGNSEFSWWAAYLDDNPKKTVIAPKYWYRGPDTLLPPNDECLFFPDWILLDFDIDAPYPEDIGAYDEYSKSIDTP